MKKDPVGELQKIISESSNIVFFVNIVNRAVKYIGKQQYFKNNENF